MPRPIRFTSAAIAERALSTFWECGYAATSVDELVRRTGASRQAVYSIYPDKRSLLLACVDAYRRTIVDPAFANVERPGAGLTEISRYFEVQIAAAAAAGLPGPGCFIANLSTEMASHDSEVAEIVRAHLDRLRKGFTNALTTSCEGGCAQIDGWAALLVTMAQGLWLLVRVTSDAAELRRPVAALIGLIEGAIAR